MKRQAVKKGGIKASLIKMAIPAVLALILIKLFVPQPIKVPDPDAPFNLKTCLESIPEDVKGLEILQGSRTRASIIRQMVPVACNARAMFEKMKTKGAEIEPGAMIVRVVVEYNGEVISVGIQESDITYRPLRNRVIDMISGMDFVSWQREDTDTVLLYPIHFGTP